MAKSRFEYVKNYELPDPLMPNAYVVIRVDGRGFHKFSDAHDFEKPNDVRALDLMNRAAKAVMDEFPDIVLAFGESDEFSFLMRRTATVYGRRRSKINSAVASIFTSAYVFYWHQYLPTVELKYPPTFDSRVVEYPGETEVRDYFSWRQADSELGLNYLTSAHINNLYNTAFWALVHDGSTAREANKILQGTNSQDKNEMLFSRFNINYNDIPAYFRKGSILARMDPNPVPVALEADLSPFQVPSELMPSQPTTPIPDSSSDIAHADSPGRPPAEDIPYTPVEAAFSRSLKLGVSRPSSAASKRAKRPYDGISGEIVITHEDIIRNPFWKARPWLLA